jgi:hypothetical protein
MPFATTSTTVTTYSQGSETKVTGALGRARVGIRREDLRPYLERLPMEFRETGGQREGH